MTEEDKIIESLTKARDLANEFERFTEDDYKNLNMVIAYIKRITNSAK